MPEITLTMSTVLWIALGLVYGVLSVVTFAMFAFDKHRAGRGAWRIPEKTLLLACLCFGWPGGLLAMRTLRHKTRKPAFRLGVPAIAAVHVLGWMALGWVSVA